MNNSIFYLWYFKPNERKKFDLYNKNVILNNFKYTKAKINLITPKNVEKILENNKNEFPDLLFLYKLIPKWIIKTDLIRLLVIYENGGIYSDVDCFINKNLNTKLNKGSKVLLFCEKIVKNLNNLGKREIKKNEHRLRISNYFFVSKIKKHPFFKKVIDECLKRLKQIFIIEKIKNISQNDILWVCGPDVITTVYHSVKKIILKIFLFVINHIYNIKNIQAGDRK